MTFDENPEFDPEEFLIETLGAKNVRRHGDELIHSCLLPFGLHRNGDTNPSASLNSEKLVYNCFSCGGGSLVWATQNILGITHNEALRLLKNKFRPIDFSPSKFIASLEKMWSEKEAEPSILPRYSSRMLQPWLCYSEYLDSRRISRDVQKRMKTGINFDNMDQWSGGWITQPRLVIPHFYGGELRGWSMRKLISEQLGPKYKHTPSFPKDLTLFNYDIASGSNEVFLVESPLSVLAMMSQGIDNVVATFGAMVTKRQVEILRNFDRVTVFPDGDKTGYMALLKPKFGLADRLSTFTDVWIVDHGIKDGSFNRLDPADYEDVAETIKMYKTPLGLMERTYDAIQQVHERKD